MKKPVGSLDRRQASLRPTPAKPVASPGSRRRSTPKAGRIVEFASGLRNARGT